MEKDDYEDEKVIPCTLSNGETGSCKPYGNCPEYIFDDVGQIGTKYCSQEAGDIIVKFLE